MSFRSKISEKLHCLAYDCEVAIQELSSKIYVSPHALMPAVGERGWQGGWGEVTSNKKAKAGQYARRWAAGSEPPPISAERAYGKLRVVDGHHRVIAAKKLNKLVPVQIPRWRADKNTTKEVASKMNTAFFKKVRSDFKGKIV